ncbi:MAG: hypothetical protein AVDCRST_MAG64-3708, partial [uncultured Phycisphaerae bacterium]
DRGQPELLRLHRHAPVARRARDGRPDGPRRDGRRRGGRPARSAR